MLALPEAGRNAEGSGACGRFAEPVKRTTRAAIDPRLFKAEILAARTGVAPCDDGTPGAPVLTASTKAIAKGPT